MTEDIKDVISGEHFVAKINIVFSKGAPKIELGLKVTASLDELEKIPEIIAKGLDAIHLELDKKNLLPYLG